VFGFSGAATVVSPVVASVFVLSPSLLQEINSKGMAMHNSRTDKLDKRFIFYFVF
jgi:hypothetical protein